MREFDGERAIQIVGVSQAFQGPATNEGIVALHDVSFDVRRGEFLSIVGPSGCGKSTLLSLIAGILRPSVGVVRVHGEPVRDVRNDVGFIFQRDALLPWRTAVENVALALKFRGTNKRETKERARDWLARVGLEKFGDAYPHQLSGGMRKRVSIASTLVYEPSILLMDEPFSALDIQTRGVMENDLLDLWNRGDQTVVFVTHDLEEAIGLSDRVIVMGASPGRVKGDYDVDLSRPRDLLEVKFQEGFSSVYLKLWNDLRDEVAGRRDTTRERECASSDSAERTIP